MIKGLPRRQFLSDYSVLYKQNCMFTIAKVSRIIHECKFPGNVPYMTLISCLNISWTKFWLKVTVSKLLSEELLQNPESGYINIEKYLLMYPCVMWLLMSNSCKCFFSDRLYSPIILKVTVTAKILKKTHISLLFRRL